jgi:hypothetical protein
MSRSKRKNTRWFIESMGENIIIYKAIFIRNQRFQKAIKREYKIPRRFSNSFQ